MKKTKLSNTPRKLEDSSWLAQIIKDQMDIEFKENNASPHWNCLHTLHIIVNEADNSDNSNIYYNNFDNTRSIIISEIPSLILKHGTDFCTEGIQCKLRGLSERYKDDEGNYIVSVLTTHDLNSATIKNISELLYSMS